MILLFTILAFIIIALMFTLFLMKKRVNELSIENSSLGEELNNKKNALDELSRKHEELNNLLQQIKADCETMRQTIEEDEEKIAKFKELLEVKQTGKFLPICSNCKDIRDENGYWHSIEEYIQNLSDSDFSHSLCPECTKKLYPDLFEGGAKPFCLTWKSGSNRKL